MKKMMFVTAALAVFAQTTDVLANPIEFGKQVCKEKGPMYVALKDPESLRLGTVSGGKMMIIEYASTKIAARQFFVPMDAKNSYGAYTGLKPLVCYTSEDGRRILKIDDVLL